MTSSFEKDNLKVRVYDTRATMGQASAKVVAEKINELLSGQKMVNIIFAAAPSQSEFLKALVQQNIAWGNITAFHMDEYTRLADDAPQGFGNFLRDHIFDRVKFNKVNYLNGNADDLDEECARYTALLEAHPIDIVLMGIGENTHIAFNDPHVANFNDPKMVKVVDLDQACRQQQVNDGCFSKIDEVPTHALTLTVPALMKAKFAYCMVPGVNKAQAVAYTLSGKVTQKYPSTALRNHPHAMLFTDKDSTSLIV